LELVVPSYAQKLSWAEQHLEQLESEMAVFRDSHPYRTRRITKGKNKGKWVLEFTERPGRTWALIVGDILYNLRATLDYLAGALNPSSERSHVMFPIVSLPVWDMSKEKGEPRELADQRRRWNTSTRKMRPEAVEILKSLQPLDNPEYEHYFHRLALLNRLSNKDRHRTLHVHISGLTAPIDTVFYYDDGYTYATDSEPDVPAGLPGTAALKQGTTITPPSQFDPNRIVDVRIRGVITEAIAMGDGRQVVIPDSLRQILDWVRSSAVAPLSPYVLL
jgi:hypothetical protein